MHSKSNQTILSLTSLLIFCSCNLQQKASTPFSSQIWICLEKQGFQIPLSHSCSHTSIAHTSLLVAMENNTGKPLQGVSTLYHLSFQNFTLLPLLTLKPILLLKVSPLLFYCLPHSHSTPFSNSS